MKMSFKMYSSQSSLIGSIIFLCIGGILFTNANIVLDVIAIVLGVILAVLGVINLIQYGNNSKVGAETKYNLIVGIICLIVAIIFILFHDVVEQFIRFIIGGWILFSGITRLVSALSEDIKSRKAISLLIVSFALIAIGIYTIIKEGIFLSTVGLIMMIYSIVEIVGYVFYSKEEIKETTTIIEPEKIEDKKNEKSKKVKEAKTVKETNTTSKKNNKVSKSDSKKDSSKKSSTTKKTTKKNEEK